MCASKPFLHAKERFHNLSTSLFLCVWRKNVPLSQMFAPFLKSHMIAQPSLAARTLFVISLIGIYFRVRSRRSAKGPAYHSFIDRRLAHLISRNQARNYDNISGESAASFAPPAATHFQSNFHRTNDESLITENI